MRNGSRVRPGSISLNPCMRENKPRNSMDNIVVERSGSRPIIMLRQVVVMDTWVRLGDWKCRMTKNP